MQEFEIIEVSAQEMPEQLGTKEKYWIRDKEFLFKIGRKNTLENCAEIIAGQIAKLINLPCAEYDFALYKNGQEKQGVLSRNFLQNSHLVLGNELLARFNGCIKNFKCPMIIFNQKIIYFSFWNL